MPIGAGRVRNSPSFLHDVQEYAAKVNARIIKVNVDTHRDLARQYDVTSLPTLVVLRDGKLDSGQNGIHPTQSNRRSAEIARKLTSTRAPSSVSGNSLRSRFTTRAMFPNPESYPGLFISRFGATPRLLIHACKTVASAKTADAQAALSTIGTRYSQQTSYCIICNFRESSGLCGSSILMDSATRGLDSNPRLRLRPDFGWFHIVIPTSFRDRTKNRVGDFNGSGPRVTVDRGCNPGLNTDHKVVKLVQDCIPRLQGALLALEAHRRIGDPRTPTD